MTYGNRLNPIGIYTVSRTRTQNSSFQTWRTGSVFAVWPTLEHVEYRDIDSIRESQVDEHSGRVVFHVPAVLVAVVRVVPFVGRQQQLVQNVRYVPVDQLAMVFCVERDRRDDLQHEHEQLLKVHRTNGLSSRRIGRRSGGAENLERAGRGGEDDTLSPSPGRRAKCVFQVLAVFTPRFSIESRPFPRRAVCRSSPKANRHIGSVFSPENYRFIDGVRSGPVNRSTKKYKNNRRFCDLKTRFPTTMPARVVWGGE